MSIYNRRSSRPAQFGQQQFRLKTLSYEDTELYNNIMQEQHRQHRNLELIASENVCSTAVLEALGSVLNDKYAEGYPGKRYYGGCEFVDQIENLARNRLCELFQAEYANVQPHSGSNANLAVYMAVLKPGDTILGMDLAQGGHLTHGSKANYSGKWFKVQSYGVSKDDYRIDYDELESLAKKHKPQLIIAGASSYPRHIDFQRFREIADSVSAYLMVDMAHIAGLVAAKCHPSPIPHAHFVTSTTHKTLRGPRGGIIIIGANGENNLGIDAKDGKTRTWGEVIDSAVMPGLQGGPLVQVIAAKAVAFKEAQEVEFVRYQQQTIKNSQHMASCFQKLGLQVVSGGTDNHIVLLDLSNTGVTGLEAEKMLDKASITVNRNVIPFDQKGPFITSGIRIGTPAITSRGMGEPEISEISSIIAKIIQGKGDADIIDSARQEVESMTYRFSRRVSH